MDENKRNILTGTFQKQHDDSKELNSFTGIQQNIKADDKVSKSDGAKKWPSISDVEKRDENDPEPEEAGQVEKGSGNWPSITGQLSDDNVSESSQHLSKSLSLNVPIIAAVEKSKDERIVYGIVYEPDTVDSQGDSASAEEIEKAANYFMENNPTFKIMHKGKKVNVKVLQSFVAPTDYTIKERKVKKGSWVLVTRVNDKKLWKAIKDGTYTGYSMAGYAKVD